MLGQVETSKNQRRKKQPGSEQNYLKVFLVEYVSTIFLTNI